MKKIVFIIALLTALFSANAQNANRSGLFVDLGFGVAVGNTPITKAYLQTNSIKIEYGEGVGAMAALGYRYAISRFTAVEAKVEYMNTFKNAAATSMFKVMPGGRYYFVNFKDNKSIFVGANIGIAIGSEGCVNTDGKTEPATFLSPMKVGLALDFELGVSLTPQMCLSAFFDMQSIPQYHAKSEDSNSWGLLGAKVSYRF